MADLLKISILGALPGGEVWSVNPVYRIGPPGDIISAAEGVAIVNGINAVTVPAGLLTIMSTSTTVTGVRVEARFLNGTLEGVFEGQRAAAVVGSGAALHPNQTAAVISERSNAVGGSGRGRMYWPATGVSLAAGTGRIPTATATSILTSARTFLNGIDTAIETVLGPVNAQLSVWSRLHGSTSPVTRLQAGDVVDTQRRRRDTLIETYQDLSYPS